MTDYQEMKRGISREWAAARIVLIGGFIVAVAVAGYFLWQRHEETVALQQEQAQENARIAKAEQAQTRAQAANETANAGAILCAMELAGAKKMGIVPPYGQLAAMTPKETERHGRYACVAATSALKYVIIADLVCRQLADPACVKIHAIKTDDGTTLYTAPAK